MLTDTTPQAERVWIELWRKATVEQRLQLTFQHSADVIRMSRAALAHARPEMTPQERDLYWVELNYGRDLAERLRKHLADRKTGG